MKKLILLLVFFTACKSTFAQITQQDSRFNFFYVSVGVGVPIINNANFDNWSEANYHRKIYNDVEGSFDMGFALKNYDFGIQVIGSGGDYQIGSVYLGRRLTSLKSPITSYLNVGIGGFTDQIYDLAPVNYQRTPDEIGQHMFLNYSTAFLTLQSRNYLNNLSFNISRNRRINFRSGFYVNLNYRPWGSTWDFGYNKKTTSTYYDDDGDPETNTDTKFVGGKVYDVPALANKFMDAGVFVAISISTLKKRKFYSN